MKLVFCLGNPEEKYTGTRHNVGFFLGNLLANSREVEFQLKDKFSARVAEYATEGEKVLVAKPVTYYNLVGQSMCSLMDFYKLAPAEVLVVHDELDLPFGTVRTRVGGSDAGNNGIKSVNQHGGEETNRLRIGVANDQRSIMGDVNFVLGKFSIDEENALHESVAPKALELIDAFVVGEHEATSHSL